MPQKNKIKSILIIFLIALILSLYIFYQYADRELLLCPEGEKINTIASPNRKNKLNVYYIDGGPISADAIRIEFENNKKKYNIYYCYEICDSKMNIEWIDNENVKIDNIILNVYKDKIDRNKLEN